MVDKGSFDLGPSRIWGVGMKHLQSESIGWSFQRAVRICVAGYFISIVLGIVPGTDISRLADAFLPGEAGQFLGDATMAGLAVAILMGWHRGVSTVVLAILLFVSSYFDLSAHYLSAGHPHAEAVPLFWRDIAVIVLLLLTYSEKEDAKSEPAVFQHAKRKPVRAKMKPVETTTPVRPLSRGSVRQAYHVNDAGRAVSRRVNEDDQRELIARTIASS